MTGSYDRPCPSCGERFSASTDRGICPSCGLFSRVDRNGVGIGVLRTYHEVSLNDWPYESVTAPFALVLQAFADGGGPLFLADRYDDYPVVNLVHSQLTSHFNELRTNVDVHVPNTTYRDDVTEPNDMTVFPLEYSNAERVSVLTWYDGQTRCDLVRCLTSDGGSIDAILDGDAFWY